MCIKFYTLESIYRLQETGLKEKSEQYCIQCDKLRVQILNKIQTGIFKSHYVVCLGTENKRIFKLNCKGTSTVLFNPNHSKIHLIYRTRITRMIINLQSD